ncbi:MAG TPA: FtsX-like permease family protein [Bacteroidales bacterium]|nr:FtsX-like permease family protein [Bacteroidales bacterium]
MKTYKMAWRNLWRNKRRTLITVSAVVFAVFLSTFMSSMQEGTYSKMIENVVSLYSGYIQIHEPNYWESKSINDIYAPENDFYDKINNTPNVTMSFPRIESFTLLSTGENTKAAALIGVDPAKENQMTRLAHWVEQGVYLKPGDDGLLVPVNLAKQLNVKTGDTLVLLSTGYHGATAAGLFPVRGILNFPSPQMNSLGVYADIQKAKDFFSTEGKITSTVIMVDDYSKLNHTKQLLKKQLGDKYSIMSWDEMQPEIVQMIQQDRAGGVIMKAIIYIVIGFGILGTIIMMMSERRKELAIMVAVGMKRGKIIKTLFFETLYIGLLGVVLGFVFSTPIMIYLVHHPIPLPDSMADVYEKFGFEAKMFFSLYYPVFLNQVLTVFAISITVFLYPWVTISKFNLIKTLRS